MGILDYINDQVPTRPKTEEKREACRIDSADCEGFALVWLICEVALMAVGSEWLDCSTTSISSPSVIRHTKYFEPIIYWEISRDEMHTASGALGECQIYGTH